jgi:hypothetical protein
MPICRATATASAPIDAGWSTTTSTRPRCASAPNTVRSAVSSLGSALSCTRLPAASSAQAWCSDLPTSNPQKTTNGTGETFSDSDNRGSFLVVAGRPRAPEVVEEHAHRRARESASRSRRRSKQAETATVRGAYAAKACR